MTRDGATQFFISVVSVIFLRGVVIAPLSAQTGVDVATWHNDTHRTGQNLNETSITSSTLSTFGQFCSVQLDGQVYAQPLVVTNVTIGSTKYSSVVYVVTQNDTLYAIDGNPNDGNPPCKILNGNGNGTSLLTGLLSGQSPVACRNVGSRDCKTVSPVVGILGTPVINLVSSGVGAIYLVTESQDSSGNYYHYLHAVDIGNFTENSSSPVRIAPPNSSPSQASMFSQQHIQRPGLLLANCGTNCGNNNYVYVAFSMMDGNLAPYPNGAMFGYNTSNLGGPFQYFKSSQGLTGSDGGGIWQDGAAPAFGKDDTGANFIYFNTGNGAYDGTSNWGDSFIKLDPANLTVPVASFTPADQWYRQSPTCTSALNPGDMDFGSGGVTLIPDSELVNWGDLAVSGDKEGGIWFIDRTAPGGFNGSTCNNSCTCTAIDNVVQTYWTGTPHAGQVIHNNPGFWEYTNTTSGDVNYLYLSTTTQYQPSLLPGKLTQTIELRSELFNIFNHANFNSVQTAFGAGNYGQLVGAADPRIVEFALRYQF